MHFQHSSSCNLLVSIGAVAFFTELRPNIDSTLRPTLDVLLERLFHITSRQDEAKKKNRRCVYGGSTQEDKRGTYIIAIIISLNDSYLRCFFSFVEYFQSRDDVFSMFVYTITLL